MLLTPNSYHEIEHHQYLKTRIRSKWSDHVGGKEVHMPEELQLFVKSFSLENYLNNFVNCCLYFNLNSNKSKLNRIIFSAMHEYNE